MVHDAVGIKAISYLCIMGSVRQSKIETVMQRELSVFFQRNAREIALGNMVTVTKVNVTSDLSLARVYVSIFGSAEKEDVLKSIKEHKSKVRGAMGVALKNLRKMPDMVFKIDDSLEYAQKIDELLKK
jgi:ribosome-binding factor A